MFYVSNIYYLQPFYYCKTQLYENLHIYLGITVIIILISIFVYIKLRFPFWNIQPVYHSYDFWRRLYMYPFIIQPTFRIKNTNKFHDLQHVEIIPFVDATNDNKQTFINLLQCFLLPSENSIFVFNYENLETYFGGHMFSSFISFYKEQYNNTDIACISSRSGELFIKNFNEYNENSLHMSIPIYYIDFLCIKRDLDYKKISRILLQTHIYKQQILQHIENIQNKCSQKIIMISIFRREKELLSGIIPLIQFKTLFYKISDFNQFTIPFPFPLPLPEHVLLINITATNLDIFIDFLEECKNSNRFSVFLRTDISNLIGLIKSGILYVYCLKYFDTVYGVYIFRDTRSNYDDFGSILQLVGSINNCSSQDLFINGFFHSMNEIVKKIPVYQIIMIDEISDNSIILRTCGQIYGRIYKNIINEYWSAYYLYNMIVPYSPLKTVDFFILF